MASSYSAFEVNLVLYDGTDSIGNTMLINLPINGFNGAKYDGDKLLDFIEALEPCLGNAIENIEVVFTSPISIS